MTRFSRFLPKIKKQTKTASLNSTVTTETMTSTYFEEEEESYEFEESIRMEDCASVTDNATNLKNSASTALTCDSLEFSELPDGSESEVEDSVLSSFHASYDLGKSLGEGAFGTVWQCSSKSKSSDGRPQESLAVKSVPAAKYNDTEIEILEMLEDCPHIVKVEDVIHDFDESFIIMKEQQGGDLLDRLGKKEVYTEAEAKVLFKTVLETVQFCHNRGVAHCDIKSENILLTHTDDDTTMQLADFGLSKIFRHPDGTREPLLPTDGSAEYAAPEVFNRGDGDEDGYDERCDIWSCGVLLYLLLGGYPPFEGDSPWDTIRNVGRGKYKFHSRYWKGISLDAKILIAKMMQVNPDNRCTLDEALASPWFANRQVGIARGA